VSQNPYGRFDDAAREYVITRPDTPLPWLNYLGQDEFFGLCTNTAGGYTFWKDAKLRRLTRYRYNNVPYDLGGRYLYVNDAGSVWNPGWKPTKAKLDKYECRHGLGYTTHRRRKGWRGSDPEDVRAPGREPGTVAGHRAQHRQGREVPEALLLPGVLLLRGTERHDQLPAHVQHRRSGNRRQRHLPQDRIPRTSQPLHAVRLHPRHSAGYDTSRDAFVGIHEGLHEAKVPFAGKASNSKAFGWNPIGSHRSLAGTPARTSPRPSRSSWPTWTTPWASPEKFVAPYVMNKTVGKAIVEKYSKPGAVEAAFASLKAYWDENCWATSKWRARTPTPPAWPTPGTSTSAWPPST
jgi:cellobiose phosphorylase